ncbi:MAG: oligoendopeptidase, partial [Thermoplasmata archaeon]|nr:oligoendopeptidase [Thermoplasmata archaeon]
MEEKKSSAHGVRWDLSDLYASIDDPKITSDTNDIKQRASSFESKYRDMIKPGLSPGQLFEAVKDLESIYQDAVKPLYFAHLT